MQNQKSKSRVGKLAIDNDHDDPLIEIITNEDEWTVGDFVFEGFVVGEHLITEETDYEVHWKRWRTIEAKGIRRDQP